MEEAKDANSFSRKVASPRPALAQALVKPEPEFVALQLTVLPANTMLPVTFDDVELLMPSAVGESPIAS